MAFSLFKPKPTTLILDGDSTFIPPSRRSFLIGATATLICAPSIVRAASLMNIRGEPLLRKEFIPCDGQIIGEMDDPELFNAVESGFRRINPDGANDERRYGGSVESKTFATPDFNTVHGSDFFGAKAPATYEMDRKGNLYMSIRPVESMRTALVEEMKGSTFSPQEATALLAGERIKL